MTTDNSENFRQIAIIDSIFDSDILHSIHGFVYFIRKNSFYNQPSKGFSTTKKYFLATSMNMKYNKIVLEQIFFNEVDFMERYYQEEIERAPLEKIREIQNEKLVKQVKHVWDNVEYYRKKMQEKNLTPDDI